MQCQAHNMSILKIRYIIIIVIIFALIECCCCIHVNHSPPPLATLCPASDNVCVWVCVSVQAVPRGILCVLLRKLRVTLSLLLLSPCPFAF